MTGTQRAYIEGDRFNFILHLGADERPVRANRAD